MRTNAIIRIIACSLGIVILTGLLLTGLGVRMFMTTGSSHEITQSAQVVTTDPANIRNIKIEWAAGSITLEPVTGLEEIRFYESEVEEQHRMVCKVSGDTLNIQYGKSTGSLISFGTSTVSKQLIIHVPAGWVCKELSIDAAAADVEIRDMTIGELDFDGASGTCILDNCTVTELDVDAASGDLTFSGSLDTLDFDGASADCKLVLTTCPSHISLDSMSGQLDITLPSDCGFTANTDGLTCSFSTDFQTTSQGRSYLHGDGSCRIEIEALSGSVSIHDGGYSCHGSSESHHSGHH